MTQSVSKCLKVSHFSKGIYQNLYSLNLLLSYFPSLIPFIVSGFLRVGFMRCIQTAHIRVDSLGYGAHLRRPPMVRLIPPPSQQISLRVRFAFNVGKWSNSRNKRASFSFCPLSISKVFEIFSLISL